METAASVIKDLTTCPICLDLFDNPKSLPCLHAFCLNCLQGHFKDKCTRDEVPCPACGREFEIPSKGLTDLQHHFFVQRLVDLRKAAAEEFENSPCEVCAQDADEGAGAIPVATMYCIDCSQKLCRSCARPHKWMKDGGHEVKPMESDAELEPTSVRGSACGSHRKEQVRLYCRDCDLNVCLICKAVSHQNHDSVYLQTAADSFRQTMNENDAKISSAIVTARQQSEQTNLDSIQLRYEADDIRNVIVATADVVKRSVDNQVSKGG